MDEFVANWGPTQPPAMRYEAMCPTIAEAHRVEEVKDIRHKALAVYARQANDGEAEWQCRQIRLRAERRAGQLLADNETGGECTAGPRFSHRGGPVGGAARDGAVAKSSAARLRIFGIPTRLVTSVTRFFPIEIVP